MSVAKKLYDFKVDVFQDKNPFLVAKFTGREAMSSLYEFKILLITLERLDADSFSSVVNSPARLIFLHPKEGGEETDNNIYHNGIVSCFEYLQNKGQYHVYRATLVPRLWRLTRTHSSKIFLKKSTAGIIKEVLDDASLQAGGENEPGDYVLNATNSVNGQTIECAGTEAGEDRTLDYVCMFEQSPFNFISQRMERNGLYYFFDQGDAHETLYITDNNSVHKPIPGDGKVPFSPAWQQGSANDKETVSALHLRQEVIPAEVQVRDYNYMQPKAKLDAEQTIATEGASEVFGQIYDYGSHVRYETEAKAQAQLRKQELLSRQRVFTGTSSVRAMRPGHTFEFTENSSTGFDEQGFLITEVQHQGHQAGYLYGARNITIKVAENEPVYINHFSCIDSTLQYRAPRSTPKRLFHGLITGTVGGEGEVGKPVLDEHGRYMVRMHFDNSAPADGSSSGWVRLILPYAGKGVTMHFPLLKGSEVLISFVNGDPDLPIIVGAVHNKETPSIITSANKHLNAIQTATKQVIYISDKPDDMHIMCGTIDNYANIMVESPPKPEKGDYASKTSVAGNEYKLMLGNYGRLILGNKVDCLVGSKTGITVAPEYKLSLGPKYDVRLNLPKSLRQKAYGSLSKAMLGGALLPLNVKWNMNDSFDWGSGSTFAAKASKTSLGQEKATMLGGASTMVQGIAGKVGAGVTACMAAAMVSTLVVNGLKAQSYRGKDKHLDQTNSDTNRKNTLEFAGLSAIPNVTVAMVMNTFLNNYHKKLKTMTEKELRVGGMVRCNNQGVQIQSHTHGLAEGLSNTKVVIKSMDVSPGPPGSATVAVNDESSITLAPKGESIAIQRGKDGASLAGKIEMKNDECNISTSNNSEQGCFESAFKISGGASSLTVNSGEERLSLNLYPGLSLLKVGSNSKLAVGKNGINIALGDKSLDLSQNDAELSNGGNKLTISSTGIDIVTSGGSTVKVNTRGVQLE